MFNFINMRKLTQILILILITLFTNSCGNNYEKIIAEQNNNIAEIEALIGESITEEVEPNKSYNIDGEEIFIRTGPGNNYNKIINTKATEALNETHYLTLDNSCKVVIEEENGEWARIRVVDPYWLGDSHKGWVPLKNIRKTEKVLPKLDANKFEILNVDSTSILKNYLVLIKFKNFTKQDITDFVRQLRTEFCKGNCNISIINTNSISSLIYKRDLDGSDYIKVADNFVAESYFDSPELIQWYPFQDIKYKELGGKNWNKEPIN